MIYSHKIYKGGADMPKIFASQNTINKGSCGRPPTKELLEVEILSSGKQNIKELYAEILKKEISRI